MKDALGIARYKYQAVPSQEDGQASYTGPGPWASRHKSAAKLTLFGVSSALIVYLAFAFVYVSAAPELMPISLT